MYFVIIKAILAKDLYLEITEWLFLNTERYFWSQSVTSKSYNGVQTFVAGLYIPVFTILRLAVPPPPATCYTSIAVLFFFRKND